MKSKTKKFNSNNILQNQVKQLLNEQINQKINFVQNTKNPNVKKVKTYQKEDEQDNNMLFNSIDYITNLNKKNNNNINTKIGNIYTK
jgi:hypothetical protein